MLDLRWCGQEGRVGRQALTLCGLQALRALSQPCHQRLLWLQNQVRVCVDQSICSKEEQISTFGQRIVLVSSALEKSWKPLPRAALVMGRPGPLPLPSPDPEVLLPLLQGPWRAGASAPGAGPEPHSRLGPPRCKAHGAWRRGDRRPNQPGHVLVRAHFPLSIKTAFAQRQTAQP